MVGRMVGRVVVVVLLDVVRRMCFRDPRRLMMVVGRMVDVCDSALPYGVWWTAA